MTINSLQAGRAAAAIAVLLYHSEDTLSYPKYLGAHVFEPARAMHFGVCYFFVLSGFLMMHLHKSDFGRPEKVKQFFWKRALRIYPVLWAALLLAIVLTVIVRSSVDLGFWAYIAAFSAAPYRMDEPLLAVEWTLRHEILFYALFGLTMLSPRLLTPVTALSLVASCLQGPDDGFFGVLVSPYNSLFILGAACAKFWGGKILSKAQAVSLLLAGVSLFLTTWILEVCYWDEAGGLKDVLGYGFGSAAILLGLLVLEKQGAVRFPRLLLFLGDASYSIYLVHYLAVSALSKIATLTVQDRYMGIPAFIFVATGALIFGVMFFVMVERPITSTVRRLRHQP